jgi:UDP-glucose 4-epimerase
MTKILVTGGAGFIGSNLVDRLLRDGHDVTIYDNFSTGRDDFLAEAKSHPRCTIVRADVLDVPALDQAMAGVETAFHLAANADVRFGTNHPSRDLEQNTIATFNVLDSLRRAGGKTIVFSSTGSVYGEPDVFPTPENAPFPIQTSLYAASKLAGEAMIQAYAEGFGIRGVVCRFVSILGPRYTHGHVFDFVKQLLADSTKLRVLGNGKQRKSYLHIADCIDAMLTILAKDRNPKTAVYNLGANEYCEVDQSVGWITAEMGVSPTLEHTGGERGWIGDSPFIFLDTTKLRSLGWSARYSIRESVQETARYLLANRHLLSRRA